MHKQFIICL